MEVAAASCSRRQEPRLLRSEEQCSDTGADGRTTGGQTVTLLRKLSRTDSGLSELVRVSIGWQIGEVYHEQIGLCHDEKLYSTIWSNYTLHGANIDFRSCCHSNIKVTGSSLHTQMENFLFGSHFQLTKERFIITSISALETRNSLHSVSCAGFYKNYSIFQG